MKSVNLFWPLTSLYETVVGFLHLVPKRTADYIGYLPLRQAIITFHDSKTEFSEDSLPQASRWISDPGVHIFLSSPYEVDWFTGALEKLNFHNLTDREFVFLYQILGSTFYVRFTNK